MDEAISLQGCDNKLTLAHFSDPKALLVVDLDYHPTAKSHLPSHFATCDGPTQRSDVVDPHYTLFPHGPSTL